MVDFAIKYVMAVVVTLQHNFLRPIVLQACNRLVGIVLEIENIIEKHNQQ